MVCIYLYIFVFFILKMSTITEDDTELRDLVAKVLGKRHSIDYRDVRNIISNEFYHFKE